jgi:spore germination protein
MTIYTVQIGDTLQQIAQAFGVTVQDIAEVNGLDPNDTLIVGMALVIPTGPLPEPRYTIETLGYYNPYADPNSPALIDELGPYLTYLGLFEFPVTETGEIIGTPDPQVLEAGIRNNVAVLPVLTNITEEGFDPDIMRSIISNPEYTDNLINNTLAILEQYNLIGVVIDFENLYPEDRDLFTNFIASLSERLHNEDKILVLNLAAKWEEWADKPWVGFLDYNALGPLIDIAAIMTYEWGYREGPPQPTAPLPYVRAVLDYAIANNIFPDQILLGMTLYGYDWELPDTPENLATTRRLPQVWDLARRYNSNIIYNEEVDQPFMTYITDEGVTREVWFENARSHYNKYLLLEEYGLSGVFYWIIDMPFPSTWYMVSNMFNIQKL